MTAVESQLFETARKSEIGSRNEGQNMTTWLFAKGAKVVFLDNQEGFENRAFGCERKWFLSNLTNNLFMFHRRSSYLLFCTTQGILFKIYS